MADGLVDTLVAPCGVHLIPASYGISGCFR
jgi:hypothetical protein